MNGFENMDPAERKALDKALIQLLQRFQNIICGVLESADICRIKKCYGVMTKALDDIESYRPENQ
ncbi:unnamed protein product, partial [marine sediment metagenome]